MLATQRSLPDSNWQQKYLSSNLFWPVVRRKRQGAWLGFPAAHEAWQANACSTEKNLFRSLTAICFGVFPTMISEMLWQRQIVATWAMLLESNVWSPTHEECSNGPKAGMHFWAGQTISISCGGFLMKEKSYGIGPRKIHLVSGILYHAVVSQISGDNTATFPHFLLPTPTPSN